MAKSSLREFAGYTTFHGFCHILKPGSSVGRRLLWSVLLCVCSGLLVYQVVDRVLYYYDSPVTVNVRINYNTTLQFPAVTICNQNAFKASLAASKGKYRLLEAMYSGSERSSAVNLTHHDADKITLDDLFLETAHRKEDLIQRCYWKGGRCSHEDFITTVTDHGVCYTFNTGRSNQHVSSPGVENGLRLTLNVEQYEYMPGPHDAAGVKMLLHDQDDIPRVHSLGIAIPTGSHVFVGVKMNLVDNLPYPHGICGEAPLHFSNVYTMSRCQIDSFTLLAAKHCGCRLPYMFQKDGYPPACTLHQYHKCLNYLTETHSTLDRTERICPVPCHLKMFDPAVSYASISQSAVQNFLNEYETPMMLQKLLKAKEVTSRMDNLYFGKMHSLIVDFNATLNAITVLLKKTVHNMVINAAETTSEMFSSITDLYQYKEFLMEMQIYIVEKNFVRGRDAMEERIIHSVPLAYAEYIAIIENRIRRLVDPLFTDQSVRMNLYYSIIEMLTIKKTIISHAKENYSVLVDAYENGNPIFNYSFRNISRSYNKPATPVILLRRATTHNEYAKTYKVNYELYLNKTTETLESLTDIANMAYSNQSLNESALLYHIDAFHTYMRRFYFARSVFYSETIEWPIGVLQSRLDNFSVLWSKVSTLIEGIQQSFESLHGDLHKLEVNIINPLNDIYHDVINYLNHGNQTKIFVANLLISQRIADGISELKTFFQHIRVRQASLNEWINRLEAVMGDMWKTVTEDQDSWPYYNYTNRLELVGSYERVKRELKANFSEYRNMCDFSRAITNKNTLFFDAVERLIEHAREYNDSVKIDQDFILKNFLQLDIFYRRMSFEEVYQQKAYNGFALICDIGGSMGLFLGASALSLYEIVDLVLWLIYFKAKTKLQKDLKRHIDKTHL